jgi:TRAP-type C4-dicarboxylate transport system permease small subunit
MVLITTGVFLRYVFNRPILGQVDISELIIGIIVFLGISYTHRTGGHAQVEIVIKKLKGSVYHVVASVLLLLPFIVFLIVTVSSLNKALFLKEIRDATATVHIPVWPFRMIVPLGCALLCVRLAIQIWQHLVAAKSGNERLD